MSPPKQNQSEEDKFVEDVAKEVASERVAFFSPRAPDMHIVISPGQWVTRETPGGNISTVSQGKSANFKMGVFITEDKDIIHYLTHVYNDRRHPVVRKDMDTASSGPKPSNPQTRAHAEI